MSLHSPNQTRIPTRKPPAPVYRSKSCKLMPNPATHKESTQATGTFGNGVSIASGQIQGDRPNQEDAAEWCEWQPGCFLMVLTDGLGGYEGGEIASHMVTDEFKESFVVSDARDVRERLLQALSAANLAVAKRKSRDPELSGMATTIVGAAIAENRIHWVSVGDSLLWHIRDGHIHRLNELHVDPWGWGMLDAVQGREFEHCDAPNTPTSLENGDIIIAASDGVESCSENEIAEIASGDDHTAGAIVRDILAAINERAKPYQDNATLVVYKS